MTLEGPDYPDLEARGRSFEGGDYRFSASLCSSCRSGLVFRRRGDTEPSMVYCAWVNGVVPDDIVECSRYKSIKDMDMMEMIAIAKQVDGRVGVSDKSYR